MLYHPQGKQFYSTSYDGQIKVWNSDDPSATTLQASHADSDTLYAGSALLGAYTGHQDRICSLTITPQGHTLYAGSGYQIIQAWQVENLQLRASRTYKLEQGVIRTLACCPQGSPMLCSGSTDGRLLIFNTHAPEPRTLERDTGHTDTVRALAYHPDPRHLKLCSGASDRLIKMWNLSWGQYAAAQSTYQGHKDAINDIAFSPNGHRFCSASADATLKFWSTRGPLAAIQTCMDHQAGINAVQYHPEGFEVCSASDDRTLIVWKIIHNKAQLLHIYRGHRDPVIALSYHPDGSQLCSGSIGTAQSSRLWSKFSGSEQSSRLRAELKLWKRSDPLSAPKTSYCDPQEVYQACATTFKAQITAAHQTKTGSTNQAMQYYRNLKEAQLLEQLPKSNPISALARHPTLPYLATADAKNRSIEHWLITCGDQKQLIFSLQWRSKPGALMAKDAVIDGAMGLSARALSLLRDRGAIGM